MIILRATADCGLGKAPGVHPIMRHIRTSTVTLIWLGSIALLGKSADWLVSEVVTLSRRSGMPKVVIGATIVSLGTTTPEAVVSVLAALEGRHEISLGIRHYFAALVKACKDAWPLLLLAPDEGGGGGGSDEGARHGGLPGCLPAYLPICLLVKIGRAHV